MAITPVQPGLSYAPAGTRPDPAAVVGQGGGHGVANAAATASAAAQAAALDPMMAALSEALGAAAARQNGMAPLFANLDALMARGDVPAAIRDAAQQLLNLRLSGSALDGVTLRSAMARSGLLLEALLAQGDTPALNIKSALQNLQTVLKNFLGVDTPPADTHLAPLPPPFRGSLPVAQPPVPASIAGDGLQQAAMTVLSDTDAAIARHVMLQIASLPASQQPSHPPDDHTQRLVYDIPLVMPQGTAVVQLQIERDAPGRDKKEPVWTVRFAIDIEPLGPVRARVSQIGGKTSVTMVAENPGAAVALQQNIGELKTQLAQAELEPGDMHCLSHDQTKVTAPQGQFVNRAS